MNDTYEINESNQVVPYASGRKCTDTRAWRDATDLELQQQEQIEQLERELAEARKEISDLQNDVEAWKRETMIANARLRGEKHLDDNGVISPKEIIPKLQRELAEARERCCQAINDYETAVLREHRMQEQRDTLVEVLKLCEKHLEKHGHEKCDEELDETGWWLLCDVRTALAAVKGGDK